MQDKPRLFIGSSTESLPWAYAVQENLEHSAVVTVWDQGIFELSQSSLDSLVAALRQFDFAVFVFAPDDTTYLRDETYRTVRDNVIFELGLFMGWLSKERTFILMPRGQKDLHFPSDLIGLAPATYDSDRDDDNHKAALGPACNQIRRAMGKLPIVDQTPPAPHASAATHKAEDFDEVDLISLLKDWLTKKLGSGHIVERYKDVDVFADIPLGSAKRYLQVAATDLGLKTPAIGNQTITIDYGRIDFGPLSAGGSPNRPRGPRLF